MIIEFYGLSGTGKTILAKKFAESENFELIKVRTKKELLWYNFLYFVKRPIKFILTFFNLASNFGNRKLFYYKFMNTFLHHNAKYEKALKKKNALIDEGHAQNIISVFEKEIDDKKLKEYIKYLSKPDLLVVFCVESDRRKDFIKKRGYSSRENFGENYKKNWEKITEHNDEVFRNILDKCNYKFMVIDGGKDFDYNLEKIKEKYVSLE